MSQSRVVGRFSRKRTCVGCKCLTLTVVMSPMPVNQQVKAQLVNVLTKEHLNILVDYSVSFQTLATQINTIYTYTCILDTQR